MVKLKGFQIHDVLLDINSRICHDPALKSNYYYRSTYDIVGDGCEFSIRDPSAPLRLDKSDELILRVKYKPHEPTAYHLPSDLEIIIPGPRLKLADIENLSPEERENRKSKVIVTVESDDLTTEEYKMKLYVAMINGLLQSLKEKGYITDESHAMLPARSELHWHAINRLADIIERL